EGRDLLHHGGQASVGGATDVLELARMTVVGGGELALEPLHATFERPEGRGRLDDGRRPRRPRGLSLLGRHVSTASSRPRAGSSIACAPTAIAPGGAAPCSRRRPRTAGWLVSRRLRNHHYAVRT